MKANKKKVIFLSLTIFLIFFAVLLVFLILFNFEIFEHLKKPIRFEIKDECSLVLNAIIHQITDENICKMMCINECEIRKMNFYKVDFSKNENSCNNCFCSCKF